MSAEPDTELYLTDHASKATVKLTIYAVNAKKTSLFVFNAEPLSTESLNYLKVSVFVPMDSMKIIQPKPANPALMDAPNVLHLQDVLLVLLDQLQTTTEPANAPTVPSSVLPPTV